MSTISENAKAIFLEAVERHAPEKWPNFLDQACGENDKLRQRVEGLLQAHAERDSLFDSPDPTQDLETSEMHGETVGPYKLLQRLGEGGMGVVYLAERQKPVRQRVALKIIKQGMDSKKFIARFEAERQALAMMDHPNIAKVLDAGCTESGRPYFVMELVKGIPISEFCDENRLTTRERLNLFIQVCQAVQHAHQKGIIHRDLKPSNVLVTLYDQKPVPKVIDFGVAKATNQQLTEKTLFTEVGSILGTWEYMSPEQAVLNQLDVDTRTDVYSLGVMLYELLTGETPLDRQSLRKAQIMETLRMIREDEPPKPSTRLSSLGKRATATAAYRKSKPESLVSEVRGDLDWIVMKALEKERARRYDSASRLGDDIQRFLNNELVDARPPSLSYRVQKFVRRYRGAVTATALVCLALTTGLILAMYGLVVASGERDRAIQARDELAVAKSELEEREKTLLDFLFDRGMLDAISGNTDLAMESSRQLMGLGDEQRGYLLAGYASYLANGLTAEGLSDVIEQTRGALEIYPDNVALHALLAMCYDATGSTKLFLPKQREVLSMQVRTMEDRLMVAKALQADPKIGLQYLEEVIDQRKSPAVFLTRGRLQANYILLSGDLALIEHALNDLKAATHDLDLRESDVARIDMMASLLEMLVAVDPEKSPELHKLLLTEASKVASVIEGISNRAVWDDFYLATYYYETGEKERAFKLYEGLAINKPDLDYYNSAYLALAYELNREVPLGSPRGIFTQFAHGIRRAEEENFQGAQELSEKLLEPDQTVWAQYMGLNLLALMGAEDRQAIAEVCLASRPPGRCIAVQQWIYDVLIPYHADQNSKRDVLSSAMNSDYPVVLEMLAQMTFGMEELGRFRSSGLETHLTEAKRCFKDAASNKIIFYVLHKWVRAISNRTESLAAVTKGE